MSIIPSLFSDSRLQKEVLTHSRVKHLEPDEVLIFPGNKITFVPIVLEGTLRIVREDEEGREVFLYHLYPAETCAMAVNCCAEWMWLEF